MKEMMSPRALLFRLTNCTKPRRPQKSLRAAESLALQGFLLFFSPLLHCRGNLMHAFEGYTSNWNKERILLVLNLVKINSSKFCWKLHPNLQRTTLMMFALCSQETHTWWWKVMGQATMYVPSLWKSSLNFITDLAISVVPGIVAWPYSWGLCAIL